MTEHKYTEAERRAQLRSLDAALCDLIAHLEKESEPCEQLASYRRALAQTRALASSGFSQSELTALGSSIPDMFYRHREWEPPVEKDALGNAAAADWFVRLEKVLQPVLAAAQKIKQIGYY